MIIVRDPCRLTPLRRILSPYCSPPLAQERAAVLGEYFQDLRVTAVQRNEGWAQIRDLPPLFPELVE